MGNCCSNQKEKGVNRGITLPPEMSKKGKRNLLLRALNH